MPEIDRLRRFARDLIPRPLRDGYHRYALLRDFGIDRRKGTRLTRRLADDLKPGLNLIGYLDSASGIGESTRSLAAAAEAAGIAVARRSADAADRSWRAVSPYDVNLYHVNADAASFAVEEIGPRQHAGRINLAYWYWEVERFPARWMDRFDYFDEIWVASEFSRKVIQAVSPIPVAVVPPPVILPEAKRDRRRWSLTEDQLIVLSILDASSGPARKNVLGAIRAFRRSFNDRDPVSLVIHAPRAEQAPGLLAAMRREAGNASVVIHTQLLRREELATLFGSCDAYLSLHRAEGFGFPIAEAMLCGRPAVATDYSGSTDYLDQSVGFPVRWRPVVLSEDIDVYERGTVWAEPDEAHAAEILRFVRDHPDEARRRGEAARIRIAERYSAAAAGRRIAARIEQLRARMRGLS
jgi:glycosyltransferase involved in cell wall biosynthesis